MDRSKCPDCGNPVRPIVTSVGVGYYCENEDKFIGEYYEGPTREELDRKFDREQMMINILLYSPFVILLGLLLVYYILKSWWW